MIVWASAANSQTPLQFRMSECFALFTGDTKEISGRACCIDGVAIRTLHIAKSPVLATITRVGLVFEAEGVHIFLGFL